MLYTFLHSQFIALASAERLQEMYFHWPNCVLPVSHLFPVKPCWQTQVSGETQEPPLRHWPSHSTAHQTQDTGVNTHWFQQDDTIPIKTALCKPEAELTHVCSIAMYTIKQRLFINKTKIIRLCFTRKYYFSLFTSTCQDYLLLAISL